MNRERIAPLITAYYLTRRDVANLPIAEPSEAIPQILWIDLTALTDDEWQMINDLSTSSSHQQGSAGNGNQCARL